MLTGGCARGATARWVPRVDVHGAVAWRERADSVDRRQRIRWAIGLNATWILARAVALEPESQVGIALPNVASTPPIACVSAAICAWERASRARALGRAEVLVDRFNRRRR